MKKIFGLFSKSGPVNTGSFLSKVEDVARAISLLVLLLDTIRFFQNGLKAFQNENANDEKAAAAAGPDSSGSAAPIAE